MAIEGVKSYFSLTVTKSCCITSWDLMMLSSLNVLPMAVNLSHKLRCAEVLCCVSQPHYFKLSSFLLNWYKT